MAPVLVTARVDSEAAYPVSVAQTTGSAAPAGGSTSAPPRWVTTGHSGRQPVALESTANAGAETRTVNAIVDETFGHAQRRPLYPIIAFPVSSPSGPRT